MDTSLVWVVVLATVMGPQLWVPGQGGLVSGCGVDTPGYCLSRFKDVPSSEMTQEQRLLYRLMRSYDRASRPVYDATKPVVIRLGLSLTQVLDMDEKNQVLTINVWQDQEWIDERLIWNNISEFSDIGMLRIPCDLIWLPDIVLYNSVDNHNKGYMKSLAMVRSDGNVFWPPIVRMRSSCKMDITYFPFDDQICKLKLGSWAYDGFQVDVTNRTLNVDLTNFVDNGEWTLIDTKVQRNVVVYQCCPEPFPDVTFFIHLRRRVLYYFFNVIIPCMLLSALTLTGFCLPPDSGEKITLGLTVLLAFSVFMLLIAENMPPTSEYVPLIGIYLTIIMAMSALSVVFSVFVLNFHHRGGLRHGPPRWLKQIATYVSRVLCATVHFSDQTTNIEQQNQCTTRHPTHNDYKSLLTNEFQEVDSNSNGFTSNSNAEQVNARAAHHGDTNACQEGNVRNRPSLVEQEIIKYCNKVLSGFEKSVQEAKAINDWQEVARVLDKVFFVLFLLTTVISTFILLVICPMTKDIDIDIYTASL